MDLIFILTLIGVVITFWYPTKDVPYWWDSALYVIPAARYYIKANFSSFILPSEPQFSDFSHPPLFSFLLAGVWKIFGESLFISHLFYLIFVFLAIISLYLLGKRVANFDNLTNNLVGFSAALILLFTPVFLAQVGIIYTEIPMTAFALLAVYFFLNQKIREIFNFCFSNAFDEGIFNNNHFGYFSQPDNSIFD